MSEMSESDDAERNQCRPAKESWRTAWAAALEVWGTPAYDEMCKEDWDNHKEATRAYCEAIRAKEEQQ